MNEFPNLSYVNEIAGTDRDFAPRFINLLKEEFRWEVGMYLRHIRNRQPREAAEIVRKSKYKFSMLGLFQSYIFADSYEQHLRSGNANFHADFRKILEKVNSFLAKV